MNIIISGASGFLGQHLSKAFLRKNWNVSAISRSDLELPDLLLSAKLASADVIINLSGATIARRWNSKYKEILRSSRLITTHKLVSALALCPLQSRLFISVSASGIYSSSGVHDEENAVYSNNFLGNLCQEWEREAINASPFARIVIFRLGVALGKDGGALQKMLPSFKLGVGGTIGNGLQAFPWIHIDDVVNAFVFAIENPPLSGAFNLTSPQRINNHNFTKALAKTLKRPAFIPIPSWILKIIYGEGATALTSGQSIIPKRLPENGFNFRYTDIEQALRDIFS